MLERKLLNRGVSVRVIVRGFGGARLERLVREVSRMPDSELSRIDVAVMEGGINDAFVRMPVDSILAHLTRGMAKLADHVGTGCIVILRVKPPAQLPPDYVQSYERIFSSVAGRHDAAFVPDLLSGIAGVDELNQYDGLHPNERGHERVAEIVLPELLSILRSRPRCTR